MHIINDSIDYSKRHSGWVFVYPVQRKWWLEIFLYLKLIFIFSISRIITVFFFFFFSVGRMVKYTGYGNAAGMFANKGLLGKSQRIDYSSDSENSDTEEYRKFKES